MAGSVVHSFWNRNETDGRAVVERLYRVEALDLIALVIHQDAIAPHTEPRVDACVALAGEHPLFGVELPQWLLDALQTVLGDVGHR